MIYTAIVSFVFIFLVHKLIEFFKSTLTVPKIKDLVNVSNQKYEAMYSIINKQPPQPPLSQTSQQSSQKQEPSYGEYSLIDMLPITETDMKNDLKSFLKSQL